MIYIVIQLFLLVYESGLSETSGPFVTNASFTRSIEFRITTGSEPDKKGKEHVFINVQLDSTLEIVPCVFTQSFIVLISYLCIGCMHLHTSPSECRISQDLIYLEILQGHQGKYFIYYKAYILI